MTALSILWQGPLAVASRLLFLVTRCCLRRIARLHFHFAQQDASRWRLLNDDLLRQPLALAVVMTEGPRWNTHALIGRVGPLSVNKTLGLQTSLADASARAWTVVVYSFPSHRTVATLQPAGQADEDGWTRVTLPKGRYSLILRYYEPSATTRLPAVVVDEEPQVTPRSVAPDPNDFYQTLRRRRSFFHVMLHYHAFVTLKFRQWLPSKFVERVYLPVGNPETHFRFGALDTTDRLKIRVTQNCLDSYDAFLTVYDLASFPITWQPIVANEIELGPFQQRCTFLVRLHPRRAQARSIGEGDVTVTVRPE
jgi:hypothetical protein